MATRPPISRILVSPSLIDEIDAKRIDIIVATRREWTKTEIHDALIRVGLRHMDEVAAMLREEPPNEE